ncbi:hypothetical protein [uncultured Bacteroides sp.]|uniref:hypothetical protein n=1 Tax=uncultured Bacteroides sp. TaxID=162156 RepID=UPI00322010EE
MLEQQLIDGFRKIFENPGRHPMVELSYETDVMPFLSEPHRLMYMSHTGKSLSDTIAKFNLPENIDSLLIDISYAPSFQDKVSDISAISKMVASYSDKSIDCLWGLSKDLEQTEPVTVRLFIKTK